MFRNKKGQAAMEFLMTYGWAILAAIIAIGVLVYFGAFSPGRLTSEMCTLSAPLGCSENSLASVADGVKLEVTNGLSETVTITNLTISNCRDSKIAVNGTNGVTITSGLKTTFNMSCSPPLQAGQTFRGDITLYYTKAGLTRELQSTGSIVRKNIA